MKIYTTISWNSAQGTLLQITNLKKYTVKVITLKWMNKSKGKIIIFT